MNQLNGPTRREHPARLVKRWAAFIVCLTVVWAFVFVIAPALQKVPLVGSLTAYIEQSGINASALYYTGVEETAEAEMYLHNAEVYAPAKN
jgi:hypothetical protein